MGTFLGGRHEVQHQVPAFGYTKSIGSESKTKGLLCGGHSKETTHSDTTLDYLITTFATESTG